MQHTLDIHIGERMRQRRWVLSMSQQELAGRVGIKFQQVQNYEAGSSRVSASRLFDIAHEMEVPVGYFFEGLADDPDGMPFVESDTLGDKEARDLVNAYYAIPEAQRRRLFDLARVLGDAFGTGREPTGSAPA